MPHHLSTKSSQRSPDQNTGQATAALTSDLLLLQYGDQWWVLEFAPYAISEGRVSVQHVRTRVQKIIYANLLAGSFTLFYQGAAMMDVAKPVHRYGCKHKSTIDIRASPTNEIALMYKSRNLLSSRPELAWARNMTLPSTKTVHFTPSTDPSRMTPLATSDYPNGDATRPVRHTLPVVQGPSRPWEDRERIRAVENELKELRTWIESLTLSRTSDTGSASKTVENPAVRGTRDSGIGCDAANIAK